MTLQSHAAQAYGAERKADPGAPCESQTGFPDCRGTAPLTLIAIDLFFAASKLASYETSDPTRSEPPSNSLLL